MNADVQVPEGMKGVRRMPIDFYALFKQAGIAPRSCKLAQPQIAPGEWCLMCESEEHGTECYVVEPPPLQGAEKEIRILLGHWVFYAPIEESNHLDGGNN